MWLKEPKYGWFLVGLLWIFGFLGSIGRFVAQYYQGDITDDLDTNRAFLGFTWSVGILVGSLSAPVGGWLTDKRGYKVTMLAGSLAGALSTMIILLFPTTAGYFIGFGIIGGLAGIGASASYVLVGQWFQHHRAKVMMLITSAGSIGLAALTPVFVMNEAWLSWQAAYMVSIGVGLVFTLILLFAVRAKQPEREASVSDTAGMERGSSEEGEESQDIAEGAAEVVPARSGLWMPLRALRSYSRNPVLIVVITALFTCGFSMGTVEMHLMAIQQTMHAAHTMLIASISILGLLELVGGFVFSALLDRFPRAAVLSCLYGLRGLAFILLLAQWEVSPILFTLVFGATYLGAIPGGILLAGETLRTKSIGLQTGILLLFHQLGGVCAALAGGINYDLFQNYQALLLINIGLSLVSAAGYYMVRRRHYMQQAIPAA